MSTPAQRFAAARHRTAHPVLAGFGLGYSFGLDPFQTTACEALEEGRSVLVAAPTGAGKTVVGEFAVALALSQGTKCFYTTPIKALSNQKYADLVDRHGAEQVGLLTGDNAINGSAPVVVMTTEVLRNMLYAGSEALVGLSYVVMDEVHYLADRFRGAVWEEVLIHLPDSVALACLSATVSNAEEFGDWLVTVRGDTAVIVEEHRPVPLWQHMLVGRRMFDIFAGGGLTGGDVDPELVRYARDEERRNDPVRRGRQVRSRWRPLPRPFVIERLDREGLLPAITFIFSRAGCAAAVEQCLASGLRLTDPDEVEQIRAVVDARTAGLAQEDLPVLGFWEWREALERGIAAHHAGLLPVFKETVEELFTRGLVKAVFATETLALGINMPARTVVLERLTKWNGETHADLTPGEYTQLTGRAGRRGIDVEGHAVVLWSPESDPRRVAGLASTRTYPLRSSFRPSYNMAVNLVGQMGHDAARTLLESSFAQFQADRGIVGLARQVARNEEGLAGYAEAMTCHLGDFTAYAALRRQIKEREAELSRSGAAQRRAAAAESLTQLRIGDVIRIPSGKRSGLAVVVDPGVDQGAAEPRPLVVTEDRWAGRLSSADFPAAVEPLARVKVPAHFNARSPQARRDLSSTLRAARVDRHPGRRRARSAAADDPELADLRARLRRHPCHGCADREEHARWAERWAKLERENAALIERVDRRKGTLAKSFDAVCAVLESRGYLAGDEVTAAGRRLSRIWSEADLLVAECLRTDVWSGLSAPDLAAAVSLLVYESRRAEDTTPRVPQPVGQAWTSTLRLWGELAEDERSRGLVATRAPDAGFAWPVHRWARGEKLSSVLAAGSEPLPAGDFVRWCRQLLDLLDQIAAATSGTPLGRTARSAITAVRRGVVAQSDLTG